MIPLNSNNEDEETRLLREKLAEGRIAPKPQQRADLDDFAATNQAATPSQQTRNNSGGLDLEDIFSNADLTQHVTAKDRSYVLTSHDLIENDYEETYKGYEETVIRVIKWIQNHLTENNLTGKISKARQDKKTKIWTEARDYLRGLVVRFFASEKTLREKDVRIVSEIIINEILGLGPIEPLMDDPDITEIMVNGPTRVSVEILGRVRDVPGAQFRDENHLLEICSQILGPLNKEINQANPSEDGRLPDGSRVSIQHTAIAPTGPNLTMRRFPEEAFTIEKLIDKGSMNDEMALEIGNLIFKACSTVIAGGTGTGKALSIDTPIPTPNGWNTIGGLVPGDVVFDEGGNLTLVLDKFPQPDGRRTFRFVFSDQSVLIADLEHNWYTQKDGIYDVYTTEQILTDFVPNENGTSNYLIPVLSGPVEYLTDEVPYTLSETYHIAANLEHEQICDHVGILHAHSASRFAFLEGLLLKNTTIDEQGILFTSDDNRMQDFFIELIYSLGYIAKHRTDNTILFIAGNELEIVEKNPELTEKWETPTHKYITSITEIESAPMACITVDSENSLYLAGREFTVTHNTSMLNALSGCIPMNERIVTIEDNVELRLNPTRNIAQLEARKVQKRDENSSVRSVSIRDLVTISLRMRPDRIVVGEVREAEALDMLRAMNTGHEGSLTTVHANSERETVTRLAQAAAMAGEITAEQALVLISSSVDIIVHIKRYPDGSRRVNTISEVPSRIAVDEHGLQNLEPIVIWEFIQTGMEKQEHTNSAGVTVERNVVVGHYEKQNEFSPEFVKQHALQYKEGFTNLPDLLKYSDVPKMDTNDPRKRTK